MKEVTSLANPVIKDIRALTSKKDREASGTFLAEGLGFVAEALARGWPVRTLVYDRDVGADAPLKSAVADTLKQGGQVLEVTDKVLAAITRRDNPQAVIGVFEQRWTPLDGLTPGQGQTFAALDRVRDPGNLGTIIRTADAAGASGVILIGECTDPFALETVRASMGSILAMPLLRCSAEAFLAWQRGAGAEVIATHLKGSVDYRTVDYAERPVVLLMGNEQSGLPDDLAEAADIRVRIPQQGSAESLNLAIATGLMLFEARRHLLTLEPR
ncbi:MAG: RNA methyltransferase [Alphaproteobacteria bacterium]|nr:MAG: RNA methyltransferase [Alphaproteobacteria bacterium]